ncbi:MAG: hypothetical protein ACRDHY_06645 [Anaerolineales bacterium]
MRARTLLLLVILVAVGIFAALNWVAFTTPTPLHLVFTRVEAPVGIIMLVVTATVSMLYVVFLGWLETSALLEARRYARELHTQRQLAERAEASRFAELKQTLETELGELRARPAAAGDIVARLDQMKAGLRAEVERAGNTLAAYIGELEDRLGKSRADVP